jgi:hypothetical protein
MAHQLGIAKPTIGRNARRRQVESALAKGVETIIDHRTSPMEFVAAWRTRAAMSRSPNGKVDRHHPLAIANDHHQQESINAREHPVLLTTPPMPD